MKRRFLALATIAALVVALAPTPSYVLGADPPTRKAIPGLRGDGPVVLPNGRVLPVKPAWAHESSVQAEMLATHGGDRIAFTPGERPRARGAANATTAFFRSSADGTATLALAGSSPGVTTLASPSALPNGLRKEVFGFLPYWLLDAASLSSLQYQLVTTIGYFGVAARADGTLATSSGGTATSGWSGWNSSAMTGVINAAHARGDRVVLTVTMMAWDSASAAAQADLLGNASARAALVNAIVATVRDRAADGVSLDFEPVATPLRDQYTSFVRQLKAGLVAAGVGAYLTVCTTGGAATWASGYDVTGLVADSAADALFVMGYDYSWSGSARAGAVAPMDSPYILDVRESVDDYLALAQGARMIWGVPYYGRTWQTTSADLNAPTRAGASGVSKAYYYTAARDLAATYGRRWDDVGKVPWFARYDTAGSTWVEGYYDDAASLAAKYDMVNQRDLAGVGMWSLGMDRGDTALWSLLANKFANDTTPPMGGIGILPASTPLPSIPVRWAATDIGSGVRSYTVQVHDRAAPMWVSWLTATTDASGSFLGAAGHTYEFRVAAVDFHGNVQPWQTSAPDPGSSLASGGFAQVSADLLNVRSGAGTGFAVLDQVAAGDLVAVLSGPISAGGYAWYQVQFDFTEWPSANYPRIGWVAAGSGGTAYLTPSQAPNVVSVAADPTEPEPPILPAPHIAWWAPSPGATGVVLGIQPTVTFDRVVAGVSASSLLLRRANGTTVAATVTNAGDSKRFNLRPTAYLDPGTTYTLSLSSAITGVEGGPLSPVSWSFTTAGTPPAAPSGPTTYSPAAQVIFKIGTHTGYHFSSTGVMTAQKSATLPRDSGANTSVRTTLPNQSGTWLSIVNGVWAGYWVRESSVIYLASAPLSAVAAANATFSPAAKLTFKRGTHTGYQFSSSGALLALKTQTLPSDSGANTSARRTLTNQSGTWLYVTNGIWAGYWLRASDVLFLTP